MADDSTPVRDPQLIARAIALGSVVESSAKARTDEAKAAQDRVKRRIVDLQAELETLLLASGEQKMTVALDDGTEVLGFTIDPKVTVAEVKDMDALAEFVAINSPDQVEEYDVLSADAEALLADRDGLLELLRDVAPFLLAKKKRVKPLEARRIVLSLKVQDGRAVDAWGNEIPGIGTVATGGELKRKWKPNGAKKVAAAVDTEQAQRALEGGL